MDHRDWERVEGLCAPRPRPRLKGSCSVGVVGSGLGATKGETTKSLARSSLAALTGRQTTARLDSDLGPPTSRPVLPRLRLHARRVARPPTRLRAEAGVESVRFHENEGPLLVYRNKFHHRIYRSAKHRCDL